jgi:outer membrane protein TolC
MEFSFAAPAATRYIVMLLAIAAALVSGRAISAQRPVTLVEAQQLAVQRSRQLVAQDAAVTASREMSVAAAQLPDPVATLGVNNVPVNGPDAWSLTRDFMTMTSVGVTQELTRSDKREARAARFEREADKSLAERTVTVAAIQRDTAVAWLDRYYAEAQAAVVNEQILQARLEVDAAETAFRTGHGNLSEILAGRSALATLDDRASELSRRVGTAKITLARWIGEAAEAPLEGKPDLDIVRLDQHVLEADLAYHPDVIVLTRKEELAAAEVQVAQANKKTDWSVQFMYSQRGSAYSNLVSLNVSVPLQWDQQNRQDRELAAKLAMLDQARAEREDMVRAHTAEVRAMLIEWQNDRERLGRYERELLPLASERTQAILSSFRGSKATLAELVQARRSEIDMRLQALQLEADAARLWAQLNFLVPTDQAGGHPLPQQQRVSP